MFFEARVADKNPIGSKSMFLPKKSGNHQIGAVPTCELNKNRIGELSAEVIVHDAFGLYAE